jgi:hypothetical protein
LILISCEKETEIILDKRITLVILDDHYGYGSGYDTTIYASALINFNKNDYLIVDSIFFVISSLGTRGHNGIDIDKTITVELFDLTNNASIENSKIVTDDIKSSEYKSSGNIVDFLPNTFINLGIRIINDDINSCSWYLHAASLILVR